MIAKLKQIIKDSREEGFLARLHEKLDHDCEPCPCSWEDRSYEGGDCDCGCLLYKDMDARHMGCLLPDIVLSAYARGKQARLDEIEARSYDGIAEWYEESELRDSLFRRAMAEKLFTDRAGNHVAPLLKCAAGFYAYDPSPALAMVRMDYEENLEVPMPALKAFQKAVADHLETDLWFQSGGRADGIRIFANAGAAIERYNELLSENGLEA